MSTTFVSEAIRRIEADFNRSADTHLIKVPLPGCPEIDLYFKDESTYPSGSLKHRLARSLFLYGLCNGWIKEGTPIVEASSGSTAISEAYFARLLEMPFHTVIQLCVADPENSVFYDFYKTGNAALTCDRASRIEGIGRPRLEPSFLPTVVDRMIKVPDAAAMARSTCWRRSSIASAVARPERLFGPPSS